MGAWGPALFSDDVAPDVRGDYRALIEDGVADDAATRRVLDSTQVRSAPGRQSLVWLALAFTQSKIGRLDPAVAERALQSIDSGEGMRRWREEGARATAGRESPWPRCEPARRPSALTTAAPAALAAHHHSEPR